MSNMICFRHWTSDIGATSNSISIVENRRFGVDFDIENKAVEALTAEFVSTVHSTRPVRSKTITSTITGLREAVQY